MFRQMFFNAVVMTTVSAALAATAFAGDLNPPVGPVAPTQRTPVNANMTPGDADSLFKITQRGSYYLTGNITGVAAKHGIEIAASGVTLDLNGFDLLGVAGSLDGVSVTAAGLTNIAVRNGSVRNWGDDGIEATNATNSQFADLRLSNNSGAGLRTGTAAGVHACGVHGNTSDGIVCGAGNTVAGNLCQSNGGSGIKATGTNGYIDGNNCGSNSRGIEVTGSGNLIVRNTARTNTNGDYAISANNNYGQLYNDPGAAFVATNPWANFAGCATGQTSCAGVCVNLQTDPNNCGNCGIVCAARPNASVSCVSGNCQYVCNAGFLDCNGLTIDGCEVNVLSDPNNCNGCALVCPPHPNASVACVNGSCQYTCNVGFADCNINMADGCEINTNTSVNNCGGCGLTCPTHPNSSPNCLGGNCGISCNAGFGNCDGNLVNGCEINLLTDLNNCGACGNVCILSNANAACTFGSCVISSCTGGFTNCNGITADGCECPPGSTCISGVCTPP
jgi:hypothetical protein